MLVLTMTIVATPAFACSCIEVTLADEVAATPLIFTGKVTRLEVVAVENGVSIVEATVVAAASASSLDGDLSLRKKLSLLRPDGCRSERSSTSRL